MHGQTGKRSAATKKAKERDAAAAATAPQTLAGQLGWREGRPLLAWRDGAAQRQTVPDPAHISPALRQPAADETPVSFEITDNVPINIRNAGDKWCVLASVLGGTPAVITETLQELYRRRFVPDEIVVFTTTVGERGLDEKFDASLCALCAEYGAEVPNYRPVELLRDASGNPLSDIRSDGDNVAAANVIANRVRELTRYPESVVHASVAGGRKTMGTLLSDAMSLFGRGSDAVSHVLVQPEAAERAANFYYRPRAPSPLLDRAGEPIHERGGRELTSDDVSLDLANKPFFRLRGFINEPVLADVTKPIDFAAVTAAFNIAVDRPKLIVHTPITSQVEIVGFKPVKFRDTEYALFRVLAENTIGALPGSGDNGTLTPNDFWRDGAKATDLLPTELVLRNALRPAARRYVELLELQYPGGSRAEFMESSPSARSVAAVWQCGAYNEAIKYLNPVISRANETLAKGIGFASVVRLYRIESSGPRGGKCFRLACDPGRIELRD